MSEAYLSSERSDNYANIRLNPRINCTAIRSVSRTCLTLILDMNVSSQYQEARNKQRNMVTNRSVNHLVSQLGEFMTYLQSFLATISTWKWM